MATVTKKRTGRKTSAAEKTGQAQAKNNGSQISCADIQQKAYELFQQRGGFHGNDLSDWLEAEKLLVGNK